MTTRDVKTFSGPPCPACGRPQCLSKTFAGLTTQQSASLCWGSHTEACVAVAALLGRGKMVTNLDSPDQVYARGDTLSVALWYPRLETSKLQHVQVELLDVRAADAIRITFDFERDGYLIERCILDGEEDSGFRYKEVAFVDGDGDE